MCSYLGTGKDHLQFIVVIRDPRQKTRSFQNGSILFVLFASIAMIGVIGVVGMNIMKGPVRAMADVTRRTIAENHMIASGKLALIMSAREVGDCDKDGLVEPIEWANAPTGKPFPLNGGVLPPTIGAALTDPWGNPYGYCAWDHGPIRQDVLCGASAKRLNGANTPDKLVIAIISAGPDKIYQTGCQSEGNGDYLLRAPGGDDVVMSYSFAEAIALSGGLWNLKDNDVGTATISKNLTVTDQTGTEQLSFDAASGQLALGDGGTGQMPNIKTDYIQNLTANVPVEFLAGIKVPDVEASTAILSTADANAVAAIVTASGTSGIGLKASGTSKAIEAAGIIDMTNNSIINLAPPSVNTDAATKKYVDDATNPTIKKIKCEAFVFSGCTGGTTQNLTKTSLGDCKKACEGAGVSCCSAQYATTASNPNVMLGECVGHTGGKPNNAVINLLSGLLFPAHIGAYCYEQY